MPWIKLSVVVSEWGEQHSHLANLGETVLKERGQTLKGAFHDSRKWQSEFAILNIQTVLSRQGRGTVRAGK